MNPYIAHDRDLTKFTRKFLILIGLTVAAQLVDLPPVAYALSVVAQLSIFGFHFISFKEFRSAFLNLTLIGLSLCLIGEVLLLLDPKQTKYYMTFWAFLGVHMARNIIFTSAFVWNISKSIFTNQTPLKIIAIVATGILFAILQWVHYGDQEEHEAFFLIFNIIACFMILSSAMRNNHTSPEGFLMMFAGCFLLLMSDVCYLSYFGDESNWVLALRTGLLMIGSILVLAAGVHHVFYFKLKVQQITLAGITGKELNPVPKKKGTQGFDKLIEEPLI